jgi:hypothetical protein
MVLLTMLPCIESGELADADRCDEHKLNTRGDKTSADSRGYDNAWRKLSERARQLQPFCSDCGSTEDLQCDHTPTAWARKAAGKAIRIKDVDVVCGPCNRARGAARPGGKSRSALRTERVGAIPGQGDQRPARGSRSLRYTCAQTVT